MIYLGYSKERGNETMTANYLLRILVENNFVEVLVVAEDDDKALSLSLNFVGYEDKYFELYDVRNEVARRVC
jgi:hypothetical protein